MFERSTPVHEKDGDQTAARLNNVLYDVVPSCLTQDAWAHFKRQQVHVFNPKLDVIEEQNYLFQVEAGTRIYELYSYIDGDTDGQNRRSFAAAIEDSTHASTITAPGDWPCYQGPWALETMGGAGGQTIVGVASTATHGGDIHSGAISDLVVAMHLIAPDGQEYWIERTRIRPSALPLKLIDETLLRKSYPVGDPSAPGGAQRKTDIIYKRDDDLMNAALVSCGRMGVIYSVVVRAIRQYALDQNTLNTDWKDVRKWICNPADPTFISVFKNRFVRIDVDLDPQAEFDWHTAAYTFAGLVFAGPVGALAGLLIGLKGDTYRTWQVTRTMVPLQDAGTPPYGRAERGGSAAGNNPDLKAPDPGLDLLKGCFSNPCGSANWVRQFLTDSIGDLSSIRDDAIKGWLATGAAMAVFPPNAVWAEPLQAFLTRVIVFTEYWIIVFSEIRAILPDEALFGDFLCAVMNTFGAMHAHAIVQLLYGIAQDSQHQPTGKKFVAISYGVMDEHKYQNKGCVAPGDSIELFFDADKTGFRDFVDFVLGAVRDLADDGKVWAGYLSMRFMTQSPSVLAMQRWPRTVSMEIASLSKASGTESLMSRIEDESRNRGVVLHWGQRNHRAQADVEKQFAGTSKGRDWLSDLSEHGRLANLSTEFTRLKGLEITVPRFVRAQGVFERWVRQRDDEDRVRRVEESAGEDRHAGAEVRERRGESDRSSRSARKHRHPPRAGTIHRGATRDARAERQRVSRHAPADEPSRVAKWRCVAIQDPNRTANDRRHPTLVRRDQSVECVHFQHAPRVRSGAGRDERSRLDHAKRRDRRRELRGTLQRAGAAAGARLQHQLAIPFRGGGRSGLAADAHPGFQDLVLRRDHDRSDGSDHTARSRIAGSAREAGGCWGDAHRGRRIGHRRFPSATDARAARRSVDRRIETRRY